MMLKSLFVACTLLFAASAAHAACPSPFTAKDAAGTTQNMASLNDGSSNCVFPSTWEAISGGATSGTTAPITACNSTARYDASTSGPTQLVGLVAGKTIYVCGYVIGVGATQTNVSLQYGTGTACATGTTQLTPAYQIPAYGGYVDTAQFWRGLSTAVANELCINTNGANAVQALVYYTQF